MQAGRKVRISMLVSALLLSASCASGGTVAMEEGPANGTELLASMGDAIAKSGWVSSATMPGGGAVLAGVATPGGSGVRLGRDGVIVDARGVPTTTFRLTEPLYMTGIVVAGPFAYVAGVSCEGSASEDENTGLWDCRPGDVEGLRIDTRTGEVESLPLPSSVVDEGGAMTSRPFSLYRSGDAVLLVALTGTTSQFHAWQLSAGDTDWVQVPSPKELPCQVGGRVAMSSMPKTQADADPASFSDISLTAQVYDEERKTWGEPISGPSIDRAVGMPPALLCTSTRLVAYPLGASDQAPSAAMFDPTTMQWSSASVPRVADAAPVSASGLSDIILYPVGSDGASSAVAFDPVEGTARQVDITLATEKMFVGLTNTRALVFHSNGKSSVKDMPR